MDNLRHEAVMFRYIVGRGDEEGCGLSGFLEAVMFRYMFLESEDYGLGRNWGFGDGLGSGEGSG